MSRRVGGYRLPRGTDSEDAAKRLANEDLEALGDFELRAELAAVYIAVANARPGELQRTFVDSGPWTAGQYLRERERAIRERLQ